MGPTHAATLATDLLSTYQPKIVILLGIAGGMDRHILLGDVVASDQIVQYDTGKETPQGYSPCWSVHRTDHRLFNLAQNWNNQNWQARISTPRPDGAHPVGPKLHTGLYLSGNRVIADETTAGALRAVWRKAAVIEMEAAGIATAIHESPHPASFIAFKSICDYADSEKNDDWQAYASEAAASCVFSYITALLRPSDPKLPATSVRLSESLRGFDDQAVRLAISATYDLEELQVLCFDMKIEWENIPGLTKNTKVANLIKHCQRRNKLQTLIDYVNNDRDNLISASSPMPPALGVSPLP